MNRDDQTSLALLRAFRKLRHIQFHARGPMIEGCTNSETILLLVLRRSMRKGSPGLKASELSGLLRISSPSVTQMVNVLEARGLLERSVDPDDRRAVRIRLTEAGNRLTELADKAMLEDMKGLIAYLGEDRSRLLLELLEDVFDYYGDGKCPFPCPPHREPEQ